MNGRYAAALLAVATVAGFLILAQRLPLNLAFALAMFSACVVGLLLFAARLASEDKRRHVD